MLEDYLSIIIGVAVAAVACIILYFVIKRSKAHRKSARSLSKQIAESSRSLSLSKESVPISRPTLPLASRSPGSPTLIVKLRQNLRLKVMHDEAKVDRLIDFERKYNPNGSEAELMQAAIDRWERDNR
jgi:hypothetical protein